jgi:hypothetical protein
MTDFLKKIRLIQDLKIELLIERSVFVKTLEANIDGYQSALTDIFSRSKHIYKGTVSYEGFSLKRKRKFFDSNMNWANAKGVFSQMGDKLIIDIQLKVFHPIMVLFVILLVFFYAAAFIMLLMGDMEAAAWTVPITFVHALLTFGIPYMLIRRNVHLMKYNIERDLYFIMKDKLNASHQ